MDFTISFTNNTVLKKDGQVDIDRTAKLKQYMTPPDQVRKQLSGQLPNHIDGIPKNKFIEKMYLESLAAVLGLTQNSFALSPNSMRKLLPEK